ncbi:MAG TPA: N-6 DNA methylase, partial [Bacteroidia bacterium]
MSKKEALETVKELVIDFNRNKDNFLSKDYLENHLEHHFVIPFLKALGWDVESKGIAPFLREVVTQDRVKVGKTKKAPDYGFGLPGSERRLFYLEAKAPSVKIKTDKDAAFQLRRYGRSGQTAVSILFNFNEFSIYDCTQKQSVTSDAKFARLKYFTCDEYADNFDFIYDTFSREAVYNGNFHRYIQDKTKKKGSVTLDKDFVESLNKWRLNLANSIAKNNFKLSEEDINLAVQLLLDRIIFLRFCEERDVEPYGQLQAVANHAHIYKHLFDLFYAADQKYNAGIFDFKKDELTEKLRVEDKVVKSIIEDLYPPKSDYAFSIIPVEILGNAYEQFLGQVIKVTAGHTVRIVKKPELRKEGGVFYTPQYIVDYIVENTVGKLIEGKTPKEIEKLKIVDPACGSGSFLLGAYKYLLSYHQKWYYAKNPKGIELTENNTL